MRLLPFFNAGQVKRNWLRGYWNVESCPVGQITLVMFDMIVSSVVSFLPCCDSSRLTLTTVGMVNWINHKAQFVLSVKPILPENFLGGLNLFRCFCFCKIFHSLRIWKHYHCLIFFPGLYTGWRNFPKKYDFSRFGWFKYPNYGPFTMSINSDKDVRKIDYWKQ